MLGASRELPQPTFSLQERLAAGHLVVSACFQCRKCSSGCPLTFAMDLLPDRVIRLALLGQEEQVLGCNTIWVCSSCETCTTRCPNNIDIAGVMDWLKEEALKRGKTIPQPEVAAFHRFFLDTVRSGGGRLGEARLMRRFTLYRLWRRFDLDELKKTLRLGWKLKLKGRIRLLGPWALKGRKEIKQIFKEAKF